MHSSIIFLSEMDKAVRRVLFGAAFWKAIQGKRGILKAH